ncbi:PP2C family protein-serine/threonine phosphatase [Thermogemmata fonticola]|nr:SpoIIE family protein phosphatase [Thermogemmata fonticola]
MQAPLLKVRDVMESQPVTVSPDCPLREVLLLMNERRIGSVLVTDSERRLLGIFTERDLLRRIVAAPSDWLCHPVSEWMTPHPHTIGPDLDWEEAIVRMERLRVRHLPVVENGVVVGIISTRLLMARRTDYLHRQVEARTRALKQLNDELLARDAELRHNLKAAARFQTRLLLPSEPPTWPELSWGIHYAPLDHLGGDYYDVARPDPNHLGFLIADASGHSIAAMMVAIISRIAFSEVAPTTISPGQVLAAMNERLQNLADDRFVTAFYGVLDRSTGQLTFANAGHPSPLHFVAAIGEVKLLRATGFMLGIMPGEQFREKCVQLGAGDRLVFYTDGLIEARNEIGETYGMERLKDCLQRHGYESPDFLCRAILEDQRRFCGQQPLQDDLTLVVTAYTGQPR